MSLSTQQTGIPERVQERPRQLERLTAMEAVVRLLVDQADLDRRNGLNTGGFATGYPGSPLGGLQGLLEKSDERLRAAGVRQAAGLNEELAATALWGTQTVPGIQGATVDGVFGLWYGKAPGVDRAADALRHNNVRGTHPQGGVLALAGDDPNANATVFPSDSNAIFQAFGMPVLYPGSVQEILDLGHHGYALSRIAGLWVGFKLVTTVADGSGTVDTDLDRLDFVRPEVLVDGKPFAPVLREMPGPALKDAERDLNDGRRRLAEKYIELNQLNPVVVNPDGATVGLVAPGKTYYDLRHALETLGLDDEQLAARGIRVKKVSALFPIGVDEWSAFAEGLDEIIVIEEKRPLLETAVKDALYGGPHQPRIHGKTDGSAAELFPAFGEFGPDLVARRLAPRLAALGVIEETAAPPLDPRALLPILKMETARAGFFCSGCPHNTSLKAPDGAVVGAGIGCHIMSLLVDRPEYGDQTGFTQMGGEGAQWVGQAPFTTLDHIFQNVGDGTFHHSASLALRLAVASDVNITYKLLYNSAVGMTGGQNIKGMMGVEQLTRSLEAEGVKRIIVTTEDPKRYRRRRLAKVVTDVWDRERIIEAQEELAKVPGVTVLIHEQQCAADRRRRWRSGEQKKTTQRVMINERVCEGCGDCNDKSQCLSVQPVDTEFGRKTHIHQSSCNLDFSCLKGDCPSFMTVDVKDATKTKRAVPEAPAVSAPTPIVEKEHFSAHMTGIGGTGVVSVNGILAAAAANDGLRVRSLDLPGSAIKAGPVVSQMQVFGEDEDEPAATIDPGRADLFLGFDMLAAMTPANLEPLSPERTVVVATSSLEPTGQMAVDPSIPLPGGQALMAELDQRSRAADNVYLDVRSLCDVVFGDQGSANAVLIGAAFQAGAIPFSVEAMEKAFRDSGVAVEANLKAFAWGRAVVAEPGLVSSMGLGERPRGGGVLTGETATLVAAFEQLPELRDAMVVRIEDLRGYQGDALAKEYAAKVDAFSARERTTLGADQFGIALAYAQGLYKLMAYKDEYEVARLLLLESQKQAVLNEFGEGAKVAYNLHPPMLRAMGMDRKLRLGSWSRPAFVALRGMKVVRGTRLDPFGYAAVRRLERALVEEYDVMMQRALAVLSSNNATVVRDLAETPEIVRGYEFVKVRHALDYVTAVDRLTSQAGVDYKVPARVRELIAKASEPEKAHVQR